jgi:hypothetical protein
MQFQKILKAPGAGFAWGCRIFMLTSNGSAEVVLAGPRYLSSVFSARAARSRDFARSRASFAALCWSESSVEAGY